MPPNQSKKTNRRAGRKHKKHVQGDPHIFHQTLEEVASSQSLDAAVETQCKLLEEQLLPLEEQPLSLEEQPFSLEEQPLPLEEQAPPLEEQPLEEQPHEEQPHKAQPHAEQPFEEQLLEEQPHEQLHEEQPHEEQPHEEQLHEEQPLEEQPREEQPLDERLLHAERPSHGEQCLHERNADDHQLEFANVEMSTVHVYTWDTDLDGTKNDKSTSRSMSLKRSYPQSLETMASLRKKASLEKRRFKDANIQTPKSLLSVGISLSAPPTVSCETSSFPHVDSVESHATGFAKKADAELASGLQQLALSAETSTQSVNLLLSPTAAVEHLLEVAQSDTDSMDDTKYDVSSPCPSETDGGRENIVDVAHAKQVVVVGPPLKSAVVPTNPPPCEIACRDEVKICVCLNDADLTSADIVQCALKYKAHLQNAAPASLIVYYDLRHVRVRNALSMAKEVEATLAPLKPLLEAKLARYAICLPPNAICKKLSTLLQAALQRYPSQIASCVSADQAVCLQFLRNGLHPSAIGNK